MDSHKTNFGYHRPSVLDNQHIVGRDYLRKPVSKPKKSGISKIAIGSICGLVALAAATYGPKVMAESVLNAHSQIPAQTQTLDERVSSAQVAQPVAQNATNGSYELSRSAKGNVTFNLEGKLYSFKDLSRDSRFSDSVPYDHKIDMVVVEWAGTRNATYEGTKTKYDFGTLYMMNAETMTCYKKVPVVGGVYYSGNPSSPHNLKMIAGGAVDDPYYAKKDIKGGDPRNPFGDGLVKLYDVDQRYSVDQLVRAVDKDTLKFPAFHDQKQIHGKASVVSGLGYTLGCIRIDNPDVRYLIDNKDGAFLVYFKN